MPYTAGRLNLLYVHCLCLTRPFVYAVRSFRGHPFVCFFVTFFSPQKLFGETAAACLCQSVAYLFMPWHSLVYASAAVSLFHCHLMFNAVAACLIMHRRHACSSHMVSLLWHNSATVPRIAAMPSSAMWHPLTCGILWHATSSSKRHSLACSILWHAAFFGMWHPLACGILRHPLVAFPAWMSPRECAFPDSPFWWRRLYNNHVTSPCGGIHT